MRWIRGHIRSCAWLALAALAVHLALTFGHVHAEQFSPGSTAAAAIAAADVQADDDGDASEERYRTLRAHHYCAVCASIGLMGASVLPAVQALALPGVIAVIRKPRPFTPAPPCELRFSAKARAPPSA